MVRTMVYLPEVLHKAVKHLAVERHTSIAKLVQEALEVLFQEDMEDLAEGRRGLADYMAHPEKFIAYKEYRKRFKRK